MYNGTWIDDVFINLSHLSNKNSERYFPETNFKTHPSMSKLYDHLRHLYWLNALHLKVLPRVLTKNTF